MNKQEYEKEVKRIERSTALYLALGKLDEIIKDMYRQAKNNTSLVFMRSLRNTAETKLPLKQKDFAYMLRLLEERKQELEKELAAL